jgi:hypothetical protein
MADMSANVISIVAKYKAKPILIELTYHQTTHALERILKELLKYIKGFEVIQNIGLSLYNGCIHGKMHCEPISKCLKSIQVKLSKHLILNICGPLGTTNINSKVLFITFINEALCYCWAFLIKHKLEMLRKFKALEAWLERQFNIKVKTITSDNSMENEAIIPYFNEKGIIWDPISAYSPLLNCYNRG